jgi:broad specificity phosphatase PhoE
MGNLILVRHAPTDASASGHNLGQRSDPPLSAAGAARAAALGPTLALELAALGCAELRLLTSPARRCRETLAGLAAGIGAQNVEARVESSLLEIDYGAWEGLTAEESRERDPQLRASWDADPYATAAPGGESGADVARRAFATLAPLESWLAGDRSRCAVVVSHNHVVRLRLAALIGIAPSDYRRLITADPGGYSIVTLSTGHPTIRRLNCLPRAEPDSASA